MDPTLACTQTSLKSEMQNMSFAHIPHFYHRHFPEARHDFALGQKDDFLRDLALDMANEAMHSEFATAYIDKHRHPVWDEIPKCTQHFPSDSRHFHRPQHPSDSKLMVQRKGQQHKAMPKHFYVDGFYRSDYDRGESSTCLVRSQVSLCPAMHSADGVRCSCVAFSKFKFSVLLNKNVINQESTKMPVMPHTCFLPT